MSDFYPHVNQVESNTINQLGNPTCEPSEFEQGGAGCRAYAAPWGTAYWAACLVSLRLAGRRRVARSRQVSPRILGPCRSLVRACLRSVDLRHRRPPCGIALLEWVQCAALTVRRLWPCGYTARIKNKRSVSAVRLTPTVADPTLRARLVKTPLSGSFGFWTSSLGLPHN